MDVAELGSGACLSEGDRVHTARPTLAFSQMPQLLSDAAAADIMARRLSEDTRRALFDFQREGVKFIVKCGGRAMLADEPGLGKTVQALCAAACFPDAWPLLVVCPSAVRHMWISSLLNWLPDDLAPPLEHAWVIEHGKDLAEARRRQLPPGVRAHALVTSYDMVQKMERKELQRYNFVIADESHKLKSRDTKRTRFVSDVVRRAKCALLLTGTPLLSKPIEAFEQVDMLRPRLLGSFQEYGDRYCRSPWLVGRFMSKLAEFQGAHHLDELNQRLRSTIMLRRTKAEVAQQLPDKVRTRLLIRPDPATARALADARAKLAAIDTRREAGELVDDRESDVAVSAYYRATGPAKVLDGWEVVSSLLSRSDGSQQKVLVFCHHSNVLDALQAKAQAAGVGHVRIDGSMDDNRRTKAIEDFQRDGVVRVALLSIGAAGVGITLTAARTAVFVELSWSPSDLLQAEDRLHRLGQTAQTVDIYYLHALGTADDIVWPVINKKLKVVSRAIEQRGGGAGGGGGGTMQTETHTWTPRTRQPARPGERRRRPEAHSSGSSDGGGSDGGGSTCPAAGSGACITDGGGARRGRAAADGAERHATAGAPEGPLAAPGRPLRPRGHATAVPVSSPEAASAVPSVRARCAGRYACRGTTGGEGPRRRPQGHVAAAAMGQPCSGATVAPAPQRSGGRWRARPRACWRVPLWVGAAGGRPATG
uniref:Uncharacterized protein n=1 Tax=Chlamydomonas euryale TaxID=1486919 RepID=A0A7R9V4K7_9CHLO|mmetsp:Transcript_19364/g.57451  ORF Transcript_19364/g.57451 Transcript_19364/m.57451 type:complete len:707 (+) Transcript_19364:156-2276(+)